MAAADDAEAARLAGCSLDQLDRLLGVPAEAAGAAVQGAYTDRRQVGQAIDTPTLASGRQRLRRAQLVQHVEQCVVEVAGLRAALDGVLGEIGDTERRLADTRTALSAVAPLAQAEAEVEIDPAAAPAEASRRQQRQRRLSLQVAKLTTEEAALVEAELALQEQAAQLRCELNEAEMSRDKFQKMVNDVQPELYGDAEQSTALSQQRLQLEKRIAKRIVASQEKAVAAAAAAEEKAAAVAARRAADARNSRRTVAPYMERSFAKAAKAKEAASSQQAQNELAKAKAILTLKQSRDMVADRDRERERHRQKKAEAARRAEAEERAQLLEQGQNPNTVILARKRDAAIATERERVEQRVRDHEIAVVNKLLAEQRKIEKQSARPAPVRTKGRRKNGSSSASRGNAKEPETTQVVSAAASVTENAPTPEYTEEAEAAVDQKIADAMPFAEFDDEEQDQYDVPEFEGLWDAPSEPPTAPKAGLNYTSPIRPLHRPPPSKLEQRILSEALQRQRDGIVQEQVVAGRTFDGVPFASDPTEVEFSDFEPGEVYRTTLTLTNVSLSLNNIKLLPPPCDFIDYEYTPIKDFSSGLTTELGVIFQPRTNEDFVGEIKLLAKTGPFSIPVRCSTKKCVFSVSVERVTFGDVYIGNSASQTFTVRNSGALPGEFSASCTDQEAGFVILDGKSATVAPESSVQVVVRFAPMNPGPMQTEIKFAFSSEAPMQITGKFGQSVALVGTCLDHPVKLDPEHLNLQTCFAGQVYTSNVTLRNSKNSPAAVAFELPEALEGCLRISPANFTVPAHGSFSATVQFKPTKKLVSTRNCDGKKVPVKYNGFSYEIPLHVEHQSISPTLEVSATVCNPRLHFSKNKLDFGRVSVSESVVASLTISNELDIIQKYAFTDVPDFVTVQPGHGFGTLLPQESRELNVVCSPQRKFGDNVDRPFTFEMSCVWDGTPGNHKIKCSGVAVTPHVQLSTSRVIMKATSIGTDAQAAIDVRNTSQADVEFAIMIPSHPGLDAYPRAGKLKPGEKRQVTLCHTPTEAAADENGRVDHAAVQCVCRSVAMSGSDADAGVLSDPGNTVQVDVYMPVVPATIRLTEIGGDEVLESLDFGQVQVGAHSTRAFSVHNLSAEEIDLRALLLDPCGPYHLCGGLGVLGSNEIRKVSVAYCPLKTGTFYDRIDLLAGPTSVRCLLQGSAAQPSLLCTVDNMDLSSNAIIDFEAGCVSNVLEKAMVLRNEAEFPVQFEFVFAGDIAPGGANRLAARRDPEFIAADVAARGRVNVSPHPTTGGPLVETKGHGTVNYCGSPAFYAQPPVGTVEAGGKVEVALCFSPDHSSLRYADLVQLQLKNAEVEPLVLHLAGQAWKGSAYIGGPDVEIPADPADVISAVGGPMQSVIAADCADSSTPEPSSTRWDKRFIVPFRCLENSAPAEQTRQVTVGTLPGIKKIDFSWGTPSNPAFSISTAKGAAEQGKPVYTAIRCKPPSGAAVGSRIRGEVVLSVASDPPEQHVFALVTEVAPPLVVNS